MVKPNSQPVLISTDIDDCLIPWEGRKRNGPFNELALQRAVDVTRQANDLIALHLNTGRNLASLKNLVEPTAKTCALLDAMQIDFLSTNNGQELYINQSQAQTSEWIRNLKEADTDPCWTEDIERQTGWSLPKVIQSRASVFAAQNFHEVLGEEAQRLMIPTYKNLRIYTKTIAANRTITIQSFDTQPGFRVSEWDGQNHLNTDAVEKAGLAVQSTLQQVLKEQYGTDTTLSHKPMEAGGAHFQAFTFFPVGVNKGAVLGLLLKTYMPNAQAVVTVGDDDYNDLELLQPSHFQFNEHQLPNYPVVVGENVKAKQAVTTNPRHELVDLEYWDSGIAKQIAKIRQTGLIKA